MAKMTALRNWKRANPRHYKDKKAFPPMPLCFISWKVIGQDKKVRKENTLKYQLLNSFIINDQYLFPTSLHRNWEPCFAICRGSRGTFAGNYWHFRRWIGIHILRTLPHHSLKVILAKKSLSVFVQRKTCFMSQTHNSTCCLVGLLICWSAGPWCYWSLKGM